MRLALPPVLKNLIMDLLLPHTGTVIWMLIAFGTVFYLLTKFAWKPVLGALKQREESIETALKSAEMARSEMEKLQANNEKIIAEGKLERDKILKEARELKDTIIEDAKVKATSEADKIIESARENIKSEKDAALKEMKEHAAALSIHMAELLLHEKLASKKDQKELIDKLLRQVKTN
jgi:F-type H+-transporting ATPase subunit b